MHYQERPVTRSVFRAYDIRGVVETQLDESAYYTIGRALALRLYALDRDTIFVARDGRLTSEKLARALMQGLVASGIHVIDLGMAATPVVYYATSTQETDSGLMVTGSHNPADYNGIKMVLAGKTSVQADVDTLYALVEKGQFRNGQGKVTAQDILPDYQRRLIEDIVVKRPLKVVVDCGNGIAGPVVPAVLSQLGCEIIPLYCDVDGRFPNHHPDPSVETNLADLKQAISEHNADIGLAFDGDADRLGVVTNAGEVIWPDRLMMYYAKHLLAQVPGATIAFDVKCSSHLMTVIEGAGGVAIMCPTGHSIVKAMMKESNAALAGEMSGHLFFKDRWYGFDDALYSACRLLELVSHSEQTVSEQFAAIPDSVNTPEIKIPIAEEDKFNFMTSFCKNAFFPNGEIITIDGIRVEFANGWGLIRASNTTPCLVARFEADDVSSLNEIQALFRQELKKIDRNLALTF